MLNQQSYPQVGGLWTVQFESRGTHDLSVSGVEGTTLGGGGSDVSFVGLHGGRHSDPEAHGGRLVFPGYSGRGVSELSVRVNTPGPHALLLEFGGDGSLARNSAYPRQVTEITDLTANGPSLALGDNFGSSVAAVGDLDRDGVEDLAVGATGDDARITDTGAVHLLFLNSDGTAKRTAEINASTANGPSLSTFDWFGSSVAAVGDLDRDGVEDLAVGAAWDDSAQISNTGAVHLLFLNSDGTVKRTAEINASTANGPSLAGADWFGSSVAAVGDLDRDGVADLAVGATGDDARIANTGAVHLLFLNSDGTVKRTAEINASTANGPSLAGQDRFGSSVAAVGDLDRDGVADLAVGATGDDANTGAVHLLFLNSDGTVKRTAEINASTPHGPSLAGGDQFGRSAIGVRDLDRDGVADLAVGASHDGSTNVGAVHLLFLNSDGTVKRTAEINASTPHGPSLAGGDQFGWSISYAGDLDRDGVPDLAVGAIGDDASQAGAGAVHIVRLDVTAPAGSGKTEAMLRLSGDTAVLPRLGSSLFGSSAAVLGDINGDGVPDLAVGADRDSAGGEHRGAVYVALMNPDGSMDEITKIASGTGGGPVLSNSDYFGSSVAATGDLDGDGVPDMAVGAPGTDTEVPSPRPGAAGTDRGALYIVLLNADGTAKSSSKIDGMTARGPPVADNHLWGYSLAAVGDIDGDGVQDMAAGAPTDRAVHVLFMNSDRTLKGTAKISPSSGSADFFGASVSAAGDIDGDGVPDIAAGAIQDRPPSSTRQHARGAVHVFLMNSDGTAKSSVEIDANTQHAPALSTDAEFGSSLVSVGDIDGDGVPDLVAGAKSNDGAANNSGTLHLLLLNSNGTLKNSSTIGGTSWPGGRPGASFGFGSSVSVGDIDGDGVGDLVVGADTAQGGDAYVVFMGSGSTVREVVRLSESGPDVALSAGHLFGSSVVGIGDFDRNGVPDLAAGAPGHDSPVRRAGAVHLFFFSPDWTSRVLTIDANTAAGPAAGRDDRFGASLAAVGDIDRNGAQDLAVGAWGDSDETGVVHLVLLNADGTISDINEISGSTTNGPSLRIGDRFGHSVAFLGDLDRDGVPDLAAGAPQSGFSGSVFLVFLNSDGTAKRTAVIDATTNNGPSIQFGDEFGTSLSLVGDIDRDGVKDLAVGSSGRDDGGTDRGAVHLLFLNADGTPKPGAVVLSGLSDDGPDLANGDRFGSSVAAAGDVNRDGVPDLLVGADGAGEAGAAYLLLLNSDGSIKEAHRADEAAAADLVLDAGDKFGSAAAGLGDIDGDGSLEFAVGGSWHDDGVNSDQGAVYVLSSFRPAFVTSVGSPDEDGRYGIGQEIDIEVEFSEPIVVTGAPALLLETGVTDRRAGYVSGSETGTLAFKYAVREGDWAPDLDYAARSSLVPQGGTVRTSSDTAVLALPRPGTLDSISFSHALQVDGIRPLLESAPRLDLALGTLALDFDEEMDVSEIDTGGITVNGRTAATQLAGAARPTSDTDMPVLRLTGEQTRSLVLSYMSDGQLTMTVSDSAFEDLAGNEFRGTANAELAVTLQLGSDTAVLSDSTRAYKSGSASEDSPGISDPSRAYKSGSASEDSPGISDPSRAYKSGSASEDSPGISDPSRAYKSGLVQSDSPALSDSASFERMLVEMSADTATISDSARAYKSGLVPSSSPAPSDSASFERMLVEMSADTATISDSARAYKSGSASEDSPGISDPSRAYKSGLAPSDSPALSDSASPLSMSVVASSDSAVFSDSARAYKSGLAPSDSPALSDSASPLSMSVVASSDSAVFSDSARAYKSGLAQSSSPAFSDSASGAGMKIAVSSDTAAFSDSARSYRSGISALDSPALSDSASGAGMKVSASSDTAAFSDSARAYKSGSVSADSPGLSDSASRAGMKVSVSADTATLSDSARAYKSSFEQSSSPALSDSASFAGMLVASSSDSADVSDSARAYKSSFEQSSSPAMSDSASRTDMRVAVSSDTAVFSDSARAYKSGIAASDSPAPTDSASYAGLFVQGSTDRAQFSDSARALRSGIAASDSPDVSDSASFAGMLVTISSDSAAFSDSARAYKSALAASSLPGPSDSAGWSSARAASDQSSPALTDSALARLSSAALSSSPVLADSARAGASAKLTSDSPALGDGATAGRHAPVHADDLPSVSDGADYGIFVPGVEGTGVGSAGGGSGGGSAGGGAAALGSGDVGTAMPVIHAVWYERCSDEPHVEVAASPPGRTVVTVEQAGAVTVARPAGAADSAAWRAPILPDVQRLQVRATVDGVQATADQQYVDMDSCAGFSKFTAFKLPPWPTETAESGAPPEVEDAAVRARAGLGEEIAREPPDLAEAAPGAAPAAEREPAAPHSGSQNEAGPAQDAGGAGTSPPAPDLTREPAAAERRPEAPPEAAGFEAWHAAGAVSVAAAALLAAHAARRRSRGA